MRILHVIPNLVKGGAQRIAIDMCRELSRRKGIVVKLIYFQGENEFEFLTKDIDVKRIEVIYNLSFRNKSQMNLEAYESLLDEFRPDIIHSHLYIAELITREFPRKNVSYFTHCHDNITQLQKPGIRSIFNKKDLVHAMERNRLLKRYVACHNHFIAIAHDGVYYLKKNLPHDLSVSAVLLHNAIDVSSFKSDSVKTYSDHSLVNVGNFIPKKNQSFLIDVLAELNKKGHIIKLTLVGDGETRATVEHKVNKLQIGHLLDFQGKTDDIRSVLSQHTIYVHSAKYEPFGLVLIEAMAAGLPVVSLDGIGNRDLIHDGVNGFLVAQGDTERFVQCIIQLINDPTLYKRFQEEGLRIAEKHDIRPYVDQLIELYRKQV
jgi:glycosyltransferase involved in cell wall biosynthesis